MLNLLPEAIKAMAKALATGAEKKLINAALTKGRFIPLLEVLPVGFERR